jgi:hypothetical protein
MMPDKDLQSEEQYPKYYLAKDQNRHAFLAHTTENCRLYCIFIRWLIIIALHKTFSLPLLNSFHLGSQEFVYWNDFR